MNRRHALGIGVGAVAAGAGVAWSLLRQPPAVAPDESFWQLKFPRPEGGELAMAEMRGRPMVLNFWATWCAPCVRELPVLDAFHRQHRARGWEVVGLAIDRPAPVRQFLASRPLGFAIGLAGFEGSEVARNLGNPGGQLPFTVAFDQAGLLRRRKLGETQAEDLARWAKDLS